MNKKQLAITLSKLRQFVQPQAKLEQYATESELGAELLWIAYMQGDIQGKVVADLGCGPGIFGVGALLLDAKEVFFLDIDQEVIELAKKNIAELDKSLQKKAVVMHCNVSSFQEKVNTVMQNPPFGVQENGADTAFLEKAFATADVVYSIHKENTTVYIRKLAENNHFGATEIRNVKFPLPRTMQHHTKERAFVAVTLWQFKKRIA